MLDGEVARAFFDRVVAQARERGLLSDEHFTVDGTLVKAWASLKSFQRKDAPAPDDPGNPTVNFHGERLQVRYTIRSERLLMEQLDYNLADKWSGKR